MLWRCGPVDGFVIQAMVEKGRKDSRPGFSRVPTGFHEAMSDGFFYFFFCVDFI